MKYKIEIAISEKFGFEVPVVLRTKAMLKKIMDTCPFESVDLVEEGSQVLVAFLSTKPSSKNVKFIQKYVNGPEELVVQDKEVFLYCPQGYGKSKLTNNFLEKKFGVQSTTQNWKIIHQLLTMCEA